MRRSAPTRGQWSRGQGLVRSGLGLMLLALATVAGAQDPPPPGGGGGGTDYPRITNITASGSSATVTYYLDKLYTGGLDDVRLQVYYDGFEIENRSISGNPGTYTANLNLGRPNGYFYVRLTLELVDDPISGQWEKGIGRAFRLKNGGIFSLFLQAAWVGNEGVYTWPVRAKCPPGGCGGGASQGASVASCPIPDVQHSIDFPLDGGQGGSIPCVSCSGGGGGTGDNAYGPTFSIRLMAQYSPFVSSLSPGYFTPYDSQAFVFYNAVDQVTVVRVVDVEQADILTFRDGVEDSDLAPPLQMLDANGSATTSIEFAVKVVMTRYDGSQLEFTLYDVLDNDQTLDKDGRLTKLVNPQGHATTLGYSTSTPGQLASVTGPNGQALTFTYGSQISGRETLSSVTLPDGNTLQFTYVLGHLTQAAIGTSWSATYGIVEDEEVSTIT